MKRLTINHIAAANLKHNRRAYLSMGIAIFLSVFLITAMCVSAQGMLVRQREAVAEKVGSEDMLAYDSGKTDEELFEYGWFEREMGHIYLMGKTAEDIGLGYYDELGEEMLRRKCVEGRMPEKAGEIAIERTAMNALRLESSVGDEITLTLTPIDGDTVERAFTLVGILTDQSAKLDMRAMFHTGRLELAVPALIVSREEPAFATGRIVAHHLVKLLPNTTAREVLISLAYDPMEIAGVTYDGEVTNTPFSFSVQYTEVGQKIELMVLLVGSLIITTCVGISSALESQLTRKTEEIGMLRAVGATKRQIRQIFGREAWLMALIITPLAVGLGTGFAWVMARLTPDMLTFRPTASVLGPILGLSVGVILAASFLPLRRASKIMPMSVLRDTALLRRGKGIRSQSRFRVDRLMARRQLRFYPTRQIGAALLVGVMLVSVALTANVSTQHFAVLGIDGKPVWGFEADNFNAWTGLAPAFMDYVPKLSLRDEDLAQIRALPMVDSITPDREVEVVVPVDEASYYYFEVLHRNYHLYYLRMRETDESYASYRLQADEIAHGVLQSMLGTDKTLVVVPLRVVSEDELRRRVEKYGDGKVDMNAVNAGREVVANFPEIYEYPIGPSTVTRTNHWEGDNYTAHYEEHFFTLDRTLSLTQFCYPEYDYAGERTAEEYEQLYQEAERHDATVRIGAVLTGNGYEEGLYTTEQGLRAMALNDSKIFSISVYLTGVPDLETEQWLEQRITDIATRDPNVTVTNELAVGRERDASGRTIMIVMGSIAAVFFAVALGLIGGTVSRRIRADSRMIGTLRAVGADQGVITRCYSWSLVLTVALGVTLAAAVVGLMVALDGFYWTKRSWVEVALPMAFMALAMLGCSLLVLRMRVRDSIKKSIVENIREL